MTTSHRAPPSPSQPAREQRFELAPGEGLHLPLDPVATVFRGGCCRHPKDQVLEDLHEVEESVVLARGLHCLFLELHWRPDPSNVQPGSSTSGWDVGGLLRAQAQELVGFEAVGGQELQTLLPHASLIPCCSVELEGCKEGGVWEDGFAVHISRHPAPLSSADCPWGFCLCHPWALPCTPTWTRRSSHTRPPSRGTPAPRL
eukprot:3002055-Rhodomonas_salina.3